MSKRTFRCAEAFWKAPCWWGKILDEEGDTMKRILWRWGVRVFLTVLMGLFFGNPAWSADAMSIKVGLLAPMTGPSPDWGKKQVVGMELAVEKVNLRGGVNGTPVEMVALDTGGDPGKTIQDYQRLAASDGVLAVIGPLFSDTFKALRSITNQEKVVIVATASATPGLADLQKYPYAFRMTVSAEKKEVAAAQAWVKAHDIKNVVVIYDSEGSFTNVVGRKLWSRIFEGMKVPILNLNDPIVFATGDSDFTQQLNRLKQYKPDGICIAAFPGKAAH